MNARGKIKTERHGKASQVRRRQGAVSQPNLGDSRPSSPMKTQFRHLHREQTGAWGCGLIDELGDCCLWHNARWEVRPTSMYV